MYTLTWPFFLVRIMDLVEPAIAHQSSMRHSQIGALGYNRLLDFHHLRHMIASRTEFLGTNPLVDSN